MVLADLPYGITACGWDSSIPLGPLWEQLHRVCKTDAAICMFGVEPFSTRLRTSNLKRFKYDWYWKKNLISGAIFAKKQPMRNTEIISVFCNGVPRYFPILQSRNGRHPGNKKPSRNTIIGSTAIHSNQNRPDLRYPDHTLFFDAVHSTKRLHTSEKPVGLLEYLIKTHTRPGEVVLDPTMGSGSVAMACVNLSREFIGIEKEEQYVTLAKERLLAKHPSLFKHF